MDHGGIKPPNRDPLWFFGQLERAGLPSPAVAGLHGEGISAPRTYFGRQKWCKSVPLSGDRHMQTRFGLEAHIGVTAEMWKLVLLLEERRRSGEPYDVESPDAFGLWGKA